MSIIKVTDLINSHFCVSAEDADKLYTILKEQLSEAHITVSFEGSELITPSFFNFSIGKLYGALDYDFVDSRLSITDITDDDKKLFHILVKRAKRYFKNPAYYDEIYQKCIEEW